MKKNHIGGIQHFIRMWGDIGDTWQDHPMKNFSNLYWGNSMKIERLEHENDHFLYGSY